jgi:hypothetical protein
MLTKQQSAGGSDEGGKLIAVPPNRAAARASAKSYAAEGKSALCRISDMPRLFGISRTMTYTLIQQNKIESVLLSRPGKIRERRMVSVPSVQGFIQKLTVTNRKPRHVFDHDFR